jgi:hypothetical protein
MERARIVALLRARAETEAITRDRAGVLEGNVQGAVWAEAKRAVLMEMADAIEGEVCGG